jgi:hypothetical protein
MSAADIAAIRARRLAALAAATPQPDPEPAEDPGPDIAPEARERPQAACWEPEDPEGLPVLRELQAAAMRVDRALAAAGYVIPGEVLRLGLRRPLPWGPEIRTATERLDVVGRAQAQGRASRGELTVAIDRWAEAWIRVIAGAP